MNRRERRQLEKNLGLIKQYKGLSRSAKFEMVAERIKLGKERQEETKEKIRIALEEQDSQKQSKQIETVADVIVKSQKIPLIDAIELAKKEVETYQK
jgi:hypothetical protein